MKNVASYVWWQRNIRLQHLLLENGLPRHVGEAFLSPEGRETRPLLARNLHVFAHHYEQKPSQSKIRDFCQLSHGESVFRFSKGHHPLPLGEVAARMG